MIEQVKSPFEPFFQEIRRIVREELATTNGNGHKDEPLLTSKELAKKLKVSISWVYEPSW